MRVRALFLTKIDRFLLYIPCSLDLSCERHKTSFSMLISVIRCPVGSTQPTAHHYFSLNTDDQVKRFVMDAKNISIWIIEILCISQFSNDFIPNVLISFALV